MSDSKDDNMVLIPKLGHEEAFLKAMQDTATIAQGRLGWRGQAEMMLDLELLPHIGIDPSGTKEEKLEKIEAYLKQAYLQSIMHHGEWVTREQADSRRKASKILYEHRPKVQKG